MFYRLEAESCRMSRMAFILTRSRDLGQARGLAGTLKRLNNRILLRGVRDLSATDRELAMIASRHGPPPLWEREEGFHTLIRIILEQQVSLASADAAYNRLERVTRLLTPKSFLKLNDRQLKEIGFSRQKTGYGRNLALAVIERRLDLQGLEKLDDEHARMELTRVKGIGTWSADIYMLMALGRRDIWPTGDLAIASAVQRVKGLPTRPSQEDLSEMSQAWRPWRAVAARLLWHFYLAERGGRQE
jgi:DNA-3-methyladenine glycosylase II